MLHKVYIEDLPRQSVLSYCRKLIIDGCDPNDSIKAYRRRESGDILCLIVKNIGEGAKWTVQDDTRGTRLAKYRPFEQED